MRYCDYVCFICVFIDSFIDPPEWLVSSPSQDPTDLEAFSGRWCGKSHDDRDNLPNPVDLIVCLPVLSVCVARNALARLRLRLPLVHTRAFVPIVSSLTRPPAHLGRKGARGSGFWCTQPRWLLQPWPRFLGQLWRQPKKGWVTRKKNGSEIAPPSLTHELNPHVFAHPCSILVADAEIETRDTLRGEANRSENER